MKKKLLSLVFCLSGILMFSQTITIPLSKGGEFDGGSILTVDANTGVFKVTPMSGKLETFEEGIPSSDDVPSATSGIYYEQTNNGLYITLKHGARPVGLNNSRGSIIRYDISTGGITLIKEFASESDGQDVFGQLVKVNTKLYGVTATGGAYDYGTIFSIDLNDDSYSIEHSFNGTTDGGEPSCQLYVHNNILYGAGKRGNGTLGEVYFSYNADTSLYMPLYINSTGTSTLLKGIYERQNTLYIAKDVGIHKLDLTSPGSGLTVHFFWTGEYFRNRCKTL